MKAYCLHKHRQILALLLLQVVYKAYEFTRQQISALTVTAAQACSMVLSLKTLPLQ